MSSHEVLHADCLPVMRELADASVDAVVTDPPYGLEFLGADWDRFRVGRSSTYAAGGELPDNDPRHGAGGSGPTYVKRPARRCGHCGKQEWSGSPCECPVPDWDADPSPLWAFQAWAQEWATEARRVLKPGGHLVAFGAPRMAHRLVCGVEDAGLEIRDTLLWLFGQGFPKGGYVAGADGWATTLKPAYEPVLLARKPPSRSVAANVERFGTGAINVDGCRVAGVMDGAWGVEQRTGIGYGGSGALAAEQRPGPHELGRWPANVLADAEAGAMIDAQAGDRGGGYGVRGDMNNGRLGGYSGGLKPTYEVVGYGDAGGPSRFFYAPKVDRAERDAGLPAGETNDHLTVKPIDLMRWLVRLVTPPGGLVLDPFAGSGTTGCAAALEGMSFLGCERDERSARIAAARVAWWAQREGADTERAVAAATVERAREGVGQLTLLG